MVQRNYSAVASAPGLDLADVARHALRARTRHRVRDALLTADWLVFIVAILFMQLSLVLISFAVAWLIVLAEALIATYSVIARELGPNNRRDDESQRDAPNLDAHPLGELSADGNVTVYGGYNPFVGSGIALNAWSFVIRTKQASEGRQAQPFTALEIHDGLLADIRALDLERLVIEERVFVDGRSLRDDRRFLQQPVARPYPRVDPRLVRDLVTRPEDHARTYICIRVPAWNNQLVLSTFLRTVVSADSLFIEVSHSVLTPVLDQYQEADRLLPQPTGRQLLTLMRLSAKNLFRVGPHAPAGVVHSLADGLLRERERARERREITSGLRYNYGPAMSPREEVADSKYQRYFQQLDKDHFLKVVEKQILDGVVSFLESKGIDVSELVERQTTILNQGVYVSGGTVNAASIAAGAGATAESGTSGVRKFVQRGEK